MATQLTSQFIYQFSNADGLLVGGKVHFYAAGTTTDKAIYASATETVNNELANPITLDRLGSFGTTVVFLSGNYDIVITDRNGVEEWSRPNLDATAASTALSDWMANAQSARAALGSWTEVKLETSITIASGDIIIGDSDRGRYELRTGGDSDLDPEADVYDVNTGAGVSWNNLDIQNAPIHQSNLDTLQLEIDSNTANIATPFGMEFSNNGTDSANDLDFTAGSRRDSTQTSNITTVALVKATNAAFGLGTAQGGMPSGFLPKSAEYYRIFAIRNTVTGVTDIGYDTSATAVNLLAAAVLISAGFTQFIQIGWIPNDGTPNFDNIQFKAYKGRLIYNQKIEARANAAGVIGSESVTMKAPPDADIDVLFNASNQPNAGSTQACFLLFYDLSNVPNVIDETTCDLYARRVSGSTNSPNAGNFRTRVNASGQIGTLSNTTEQDFAISTMGFIYDTGIN